MKAKSPRFFSPARLALTVLGLVLASALSTRTLGATSEAASGTEKVAPPMAESGLSVSQVDAMTTKAESTDEESLQVRAPANEGIATPVAPEIPLRRLLKKEVTRSIALRARDIIREHHDKPFGTEIEFESAGDVYTARIEEHYHPPGGDAKPWGHHPGVSVFVRRPLSTP